MGWTICILSVVCAVAALPVMAGEETGAAGAPVRAELDTAELVEAIKTQLGALDGLRAQMEQTLEAIEQVDQKVAELRKERLDKRLDEIADLSDEMQDAVEKLRGLRARSSELQTELKETRQSQRELFDTLEIGPQDKAMLKTLLSERELPLVPPDRRAVKIRLDTQGPRAGAGKRGVGTSKDRKAVLKSEWADNIRLHNERRQEDRQRRLDQLEREDPELHTLMAKKAELIEQCDGPRAEVATHLEATQKLIQALHRRLGEYYRLMERSPDF